MIHELGEGQSGLDLINVVDELHKRSSKRRRYLVAIAGPPGAGKSTLADELRQKLQPDLAAVVPMDGFHYDNRILDERGLRARKGAPETFDYDGFEVMLRRIRDPEKDIAFPIFDRASDVSRAAAGIVSRETRLVIVEGNYLLLDELPWSRLHRYFDFSTFIDAGRSLLTERLEKRWTDQGFSLQDAQQRVSSNDMPNADRVWAAQSEADMHARSGPNQEWRFSWGKRRSM